MDKTIRLRPYILELVTFLFVVCVICAAFILTGAIAIKWSVLSVIFVLFIAVWLLQYAFSFVPFAVCVIVDLIAKDFQNVEGVFAEQFVFKSSSFLDKNARHLEAETRTIETLYYKVYAETPAGLVLMTASEYIPMKSGQNYIFLIGKRSKAIIAVRDKLND